MRATNSSGLKVSYNQDERQMIEDASATYETKRARLELIGETEAGYTFAEIEQDKRKIINTIRERAIKRHFRGLGGDADKILDDAKKQTQEILKNTWLGAWDYEGANPAQKQEGINQLEQVVKEDLSLHIQALEGMQNLEGDILIDLLNKHIRDKINEALDNITKDHEISVSLIRAIRTTEGLDPYGIRLATDMITRLIFNDKTGINERINIGGINENHTVGLTTTTDQIIMPDDELVFDAICTLYGDGFDFVTIKEIHDMMTKGRLKNKGKDGEEKETRLTEKRAEEIFRSVERLSGKRFTLDITDATGYKGLDEIPKETIRKMAVGANMLYTRYWEATDSGRGYAGWELLADPTTYLVASFMRQIKFLSPQALEIPFKRRPKHREALIRYLTIRVHAARASENKILLSTIYNSIGVGSSSNKVKDGVRETVIEILKHWTNIKLIKGFNIRKGGNGNLYREIILNPKETQQAISNQEQPTEQ